VRPAIDHEIFECIAILESVIAARSSFTMVDLGAGYRRWTARAACALRLKRSELQSRFVAVEAEPTHFRWIKEHFIINRIDLADCTLVNAPVTGRNERVPFTVGHRQNGTVKPFSHLRITASAIGPMPKSSACNRPP
jgi:hypothetical protein